MTVARDDADLLAAVKGLCAQFGYSPAGFVSFAKAALEWNKIAVIPDFGPFPTITDEAEITQDTLDAWPDWVKEMVPAGSKWERLHWPDGSVTIRLLDPRALVLAARHLQPGQP